MTRGVKWFNVLLLLLLLVSVYCGDKAPESNTPSGNRSFAFNLVTLEGKNVTLAGYEGKVLLLNIWDTWCPPCRAEIPYFIEFYNEYQSKGFEILGVALGQEGLDKVHGFIQQYGINYPNALATQEVINGFGPINGIPTTFLIDRKGNVSQKYVGMRDKETFRKDIRALL